MSKERREAGMRAVYPPRSNCETAQGLSDFPTFDRLPSRKRGTGAACGLAASATV